MSEEQVSFLCALIQDQTATQDHLDRWLVPALRQVDYGEIANVIVKMRSENAALRARAERAEAERDNLRRAIEDHQATINKWVDLYGEAHDQLLATEADAERLYDALLIDLKRAASERDQAQEHMKTLDSEVNTWVEKHQREQSMRISAEAVAKAGNLLFQFGLRHDFNCTARAYDGGECSCGLERVQSEFRNAWHEWREKKGGEP